MRRTITHSAPLVLALLVGVLGAETARAQVTTGTISGTVKETSDAVVPGATIQVTNVDTGIARTVVTDGEGRYRVSNLPIGPYRVEAELTGFKKEVRSGITLTVGREAVVDFVLQVGQITEEVVITAEAPLVNTTTAELSGLVEQKTINDLPLNGRDLMQLMTLQPGVATIQGRSTGVTSGGSGRKITIHGTREAGVFMGAESVQEFKVILHNFSAEYGRPAGGVFNAVTKSGTNEFHGSAFEFHRNSKFDAANYFDAKTPRPTTRRGPISCPECRSSSAASISTSTRRRSRCSRSASMATRAETS